MSVSGQCPATIFLSNRTEVFRFWGQNPENRSGFHVQTLSRRSYGRRSEHVSTVPLCRCVWPGHAAERRALQTAASGAPERATLPAVWVAGARVPHAIVVPVLTLPLAGAEPPIVETLRDTILRDFSS